MLACALASALVSFLLAREIGDVYRSPQGYAIVITLTVTAFALLAWRSTSFNLPNKQAPDISEWRLHLPWLLVGLAVALRYGLLEYLPPQWPIFEEIQTGTEATKIIQYSELSGHFRHTNSLAALGFLLGGYSLDGLRSLFSVAFAISLVVMAMTLRRLSVGWTATLFAVFLMTSLRFLALGGATAEEIFGGIVFTMLLLYCLAGSVTSHGHALIWSGFAGVFGGILMYEYIPYYGVLLIPPTFWFLRALASNDRTIRWESLQCFGMYIIALTAIAAPVVSELVLAPERSHVLDPIMRHTVDGVPNPLSDFEKLRHDLAGTWTRLKILMGLRVPGNPLYFAEGDSVLPFVVGFCIFLPSFIYSLWRPIHSFMRVAALSVLFTTLAFGFTANSMNIGVHIPSVILLILLSGVTVDVLIKRLSVDAPLTFASLMRNPILYATVLTVIVVMINVSGVLRMSASEPTLREFQNNQWATCYAIGEAQHEFLFAHVYLRSNSHCHIEGDDRWLYPDATFDIEIVETLPAETELSPGTLLVISDAHGLKEEDVSTFHALAAHTQSTHTLRVQNNLVNDVAVMRLCYQCELVAEE